MKEKRGSRARLPRDLTTPGTQSSQNQARSGGPFWKSPARGARSSLPPLPPTPSQELAGDQVALSRGRSAEESDLGAPSWDTGRYLLSGSLGGWNLQREKRDKFTKEARQPWALPTPHVDKGLPWFPCGS